jgi:hypothetical protein
LSRIIYEVEVTSLAGGETVVAVELETSILKSVATCVVGGTISVVSPAVLTTSNVGIRLDNPDKLLARVVEGELGLDSRVAE